jgi:hypothetical protein
MRKLHQLTCVLVVASLSTLSTTALAGDGVVLNDGTLNSEYAGLYAWYDGSNGVNGAEGNAVDGALVTSWNDLSANARHLTRTSAGAEPAYSLDAGAGVPGVEFTADFIWASSGEYGSLGGAHTFFIVTRADAADGGYLMDSSSSSGRNALFTGQDSMPEQWVCYTGADVFSGGQIALGEVSIVTMVYNADDTQDIYVNGEHMGSNSGAATTQAGIILGSRFNVQNRFAGSISEVVVYGEALNESDRGDVTDYLLAKFGFGGDDGCSADLNDDGEVNGADIGLLLADWGFAGAGDLNDDGTTNGADIGLLLAEWGSCTP